MGDGRRNEVMQGYFITPSGLAQHPSAANITYRLDERNCLHTTITSTVIHHYGNIRLGPLTQTHYKFCLTCSIRHLGHPIA